MEAGVGVIFSGPSGCGKTTMAFLLGEGALCDEMAAIRVTSAEAS